MLDHSPLPTLASRDDAVAQLNYIRQTIDRARPFTAVSGAGLALMGAIAVLASALAEIQQSREDWLATWLMTAFFASILGIAANYWKARLLNVPIRMGPFRQMAGCFLPPVGAGAILTGAFASTGHWDLLPGSWLLLYGAAVIAGGNFSVRPVRILGWTLMSLGAVALFVPVPLHNLALAAGFGVAHLAFGLWIARRYGG